MKAIVDKLGLAREAISDPAMVKTLEGWKLADKSGSWDFSKEAMEEIEWDFLRQMIAFDPGKRSTC